MTRIRNPPASPSAPPSSPSSVPASSLVSLPHRPSASATSTSTPSSSGLSPSTASTAATAISQTQPQTTLQPPAPLTTPLNLPTSSSQRIPRHVLTRRRRWLETHPSYFASASVDAELSNPLAYDRFVRRHQSAAEREEEGKKKGWAGTLEAGLLRGEARRAGVRNSAGAGESEGEGSDTINRVDWSIAESPENENEGVAAPKASTGKEKENPDGEEEEWDDFTNDLAYLKSKMAESRSSRLAQRLSSESSTLPSAADRSDAAKVRAKDQGSERWRALLAERFVSGKDENFHYAPVDADEELDGDWVGRQKEEEWFEEEESEIEGMAEGETGVQDF